MTEARTINNIRSSINRMSMLIARSTFKKL